jgi:hypothetical protein
MTTEQRWAASGVVVLLGGLWAVVGGWAVSEPYRWDPPSDDGTGSYVFLVGAAVLCCAAAWLWLGLLAVRRVASGAWGWRRVALLCAGGAGLDLLAAAATWSAGDVGPTVLLGFSAVATVAYAALLWTPPRPVGPGATAGA